MKPEVTIGVCVRNSALTLRETIESIISQDFPHELMEVIFVDDGSEDDTLSIIKDYVSRIDVSVKVFQSEWRGLGPARNVVVDNAHGDYLVWVDGDMTLSVDFVRKQVYFMEKNPKVGIAKGKYGPIAAERLVEYLENITWVARSNRKVEEALPGTGGAVYRVRAIRQVEGFDNELKGAGEDREAAYRIKAAGWRIRRTSAVFYEKRKKTWKSLWREKLWKGCGLSKTLRKHPDIFRVYFVTPLVGFLVGLLLSFVAYRLTGQKKVYLLPFHLTFVTTAIFLGYLKGRLGLCAHP